MGNQSGMLKRQNELIQLHMDITERVMKQFMLDTLQCTLHDEGWGYQRVLELTKKWGAKYSTYYPCLGTKHVEADYLRECLDRELRDLIKNNAEFHDFPLRYPEIKDIKYGLR